MNAHDRALRAVANARAFFATFIRRNTPRPCGPDAADRCGYAAGFGDGVERRAFLDAWEREEAEAAPEAPPEQ